MDEDRSTRFVKINRLLPKSDIFKSKNHALLKVWLYLLTEANWRITFPDKKYGVKILYPGQGITGRKEIAEKCGISESAAHRCLRRLEKANSVALKPNNKNSVFTIVNWAQYQGRQVKPNNKSEKPNTPLDIDKKERKKQRFLSLDFSDIEDYKKCYPNIKNINRELRVARDLMQERRNTGEDIVSPAAFIHNHLEIANNRAASVGGVSGVRYGETKVRDGKAVTIQEVLEAHINPLIKEAAPIYALKQKSPS